MSDYYYRRNKAASTNNRNGQFRNILALSADAPDLLRPCDVERVLDAAQDQGCLEGFRRWLLSEDLQERTRINIKTYEA